MVQRRNSSFNQRNKQRNQIFIVVIAVLLIVISGLIINSHKASPKEEKVAVVAEYDTVNVPVPVKVVPMGTKVSDIKFKNVKYPKQQVPKGAILDLQGMQEAITLTKLPANLPMFESNFSFTSFVQNPVVDKIPQGMRAMTIHVDATSSVEGWAGSGSIVDVLLIQKDKTSVIAEKVKILSSERSVAPVQQENAPNIPSTVTLLVTQDQCLAINMAIPLGRIAFALLSANDDDNWQNAQFNSDNLRGGPVGTKRKNESIKAVVSVKGKDGKTSKVFALSGNRWLKTDKVPQGFSISK